MRRIDGKRCQNRKNLLQEARLEPGELIRRDFLRLKKRQCSSIAHLPAKRDPLTLLLSHQVICHRDHEIELLSRRTAVLTERGDARTDLAAQTGDAHHEEFIEVRGRDREKAETLQQRMIRVLRLFQDPHVERKPGGLAVYEPVGVVHVDSRHLGHRQRQVRFGRLGGRTLRGGGHEITSAKEGVSLCYRSSL